MEHLEDIVRNANLFRERWGETPMEGWLREFRKQGLVAELTDGSWQVLKSDSGQLRRRPA